MAPVITLRQEHLDQMIAHALEDAPNECCGIIGANEGRATTLHRAENAEASPYRFSIDFREQRRIEEALDELGVADRSPPAERLAERQLLERI